MRQMVDEAISILNGSSSDITDFGRLMHETWMIKRSLTNKITTLTIDKIYKTALQAGAIGGKHHRRIDDAGAGSAGRLARPRAGGGFIGRFS